MCASVRWLALRATEPYWARVRSPWLQNPLADLHASDALASGSGPRFPEATISPVQPAVSYRSIFTRLSAGDSERDAATTMATQLMRPVK